MNGDGFGSLSVHLGENTHIRLSTYPHSKPILGIDVPGCTFMITNHGRDVVNATDLELARRLHEVVGDYLKEIERLHAETAFNDAAEPSRDAAA
jgi:hypothetical protein